MDRTEAAYRTLLRSSQGDFSKFAKFLSSLPSDGHGWGITMGSLLENLSESTIDESNKIVMPQGDPVHEPSTVTGPTSVMAIVAGDECLFLTKLPLEMRRKIYFHLVVSQNTSDFTRNANGNYATSVQFGLTPQILRTCKQVYIEASEMMYSGNTFTIKCLGPNFSCHSIGEIGPCTLSRHPAAGETEQNLFSSVKDLPAFEKVQHWKVIITPDNPSDKAKVAPTQVVAFCRVACDIDALKSLVISIHCGTCLDKADTSGHLWSIPDQKEYGAKRDHNLLVALKPFEMLRNLDKFKVQCPECKTFKDVGGGELRRLEALVKSNEPVHHVFKCYAALLQYAQAFERIPLFQSDMDSERMMDMSMASSCNRGASMPPTTVNPYIFPTVHPVEKALREARKASDVNDYKAFKAHRLTLLISLENQYIRLALMSDRIVKLVKSQKEQGGCLYGFQFGYDHHAFQIDDDKKAICLIQLHDYAEAFTRDAPDEIRISLRRYKWIVTRLYNALPRERYLQDLEDAYDMQDLPKFRESFIKATGDMYNQWLKIRAARLKLLAFDWDSQNAGCKIDLELWREDKPLDFN
ncbi:hypothetical protein DL98DRAFT_59310 [Cadophora sp. DSE1049]|nr:hypothetical protein DL98DRAFT_59310 [Cadophora sp. DSE1049]